MARRAVGGARARCSGDGGGKRDGLMYFQQFLNQLHGCASYLIADGGEAVVVDPAMQGDEYDAVLRARGLELRYVVDTHIHADHVSGGRTLAAAHGATLCLHEAARTTYPYRALKDGDELALGETVLRVCHTPGHRPELVSLLVINRARGEEPALVLTGDSLLVGDVGRPDFGGGDAGAQYESIQRLLTLPDWVATGPGHFEGPCGRCMEGRPLSTIGYERAYNPFLRLERDTFVDDLTSHLPSRPLNMLAIEATNRGTANDAWAMLTDDGAVAEVDVATLVTDGDALTLDVREPHEYAAGHIAGALLIPQAELATRQGELPSGRPIRTICRTGSRSYHAAQFLRQRGYEDVASVAGGITAWRRAGLPLERG
jgi:glyoxylase-like metal-dependent hydrolase (beta-lactamase superfamily II)/rhodanese-related sulfurtransferase